jgi:hypothetical protein
LLLMDKSIWSLGSCWKMCLRHLKYFSPTLQVTQVLLHLTIDNLMAVLQRLNAATLKAVNQCLPSTRTPAATMHIAHGSWWWVVWSPSMWHCFIFPAIRICCAESALVSWNGWYCCSWCTSSVQYWTCFWQAQELLLPFWQL